MELIVYPRLSRKGQLSLFKRTKQYGHPNNYEPQGRTLHRIAGELNWSIDEVAHQLSKERQWLRNNYPDLIPSMGWYRGRSHSPSGY